MSESRRAGQVIQRGPNKFLLRAFVGRDSEGKRQYHSETFHGTREQAEACLREILRLISIGAPYRRLDRQNEWMMTEIARLRSSLGNS